MTTDIKDSEIYTDLLHQIAPKVSKHSEKVETKMARRTRG